MVTRSVQGKILVFTIFLLGIATGVLSNNLYRSRMVGASQVPQGRGDRVNPQDRARRDQDAMAKYLGLDQNQQEQIHKILQETRNQFHQLHDQVDPQFKAIEEGTRAKIRAVLSEEQRRKYDEYRETRKGDRGRPPRTPDRSDRQNK
jgi:hypothetical protein